MPYSNVPEKLWGKMDRCVEELMAQGKSKDSAIAICHSSLVKETTKEKYTQADAGFVNGGGEPDERCGVCIHYNDNGTCDIVMGAISTSDICDEFEHNEGDYDEDEKSIPLVLDQMIVQTISDKEVRIEVSDSLFEKLLKTLRLKEEPTKTVDGKRLTANEFAHVPDRREPSGWELPIHDEKHIVEAVKALHPGGFRVKVPKSRVLARIAEAIEKLDNHEGLMDQLKMVKALQPSAFFLHKSIDGAWRWFGWVSNKWRDRDYYANPHKGGEILTDQSHKDYVSWVDKAPETRMPKLLAWHTAETAHKERADWMDYADGFLMASGPLTPKEAQAIRRIAYDYELGMSHGFIPLYKDPREGLIEKYRSFEVSFLPLEVAANPWTDFRTITKEVLAMGLTGEKRGFLAKLMGDDFVEEIEKENSEKAALLEEAGVDFKEGEAEVTAEDVAEAEVVDLTEDEKEMDTDEEDEEDEDEEEEEKDLDPVAELRHEMEEFVVSVGEQIKAVNDGIANLTKALTDVVEKREKADEEIEKAIEETPAASLRALFEKSAIGKDETRVDGRTSEAKDGPKETEAREKENKTGIPLLDALKEANIRHVTG